MNTATLRAPDRDPAWLRRVFWVGAALVLLWPMLDNKFLKQSGVGLKLLLPV